MTIEQREIILAKVEELMARGSYKNVEISKEINCSIPTAQSYKEAIQTRWKLSKNCDYDLARAEIMENLHEVEKGLWEAFKLADNSNARVGSMNALLEVQKQKAFLCGVNKVMSKDS